MREDGSSSGGSGEKRDSDASLDSIAQSLGRHSFGDDSDQDGPDRSPYEMAEMALSGYHSQGIPGVRGLPFDAEAQLLDGALLSEVRRRATDTMPHRR